MSPLSVTSTMNGMWLTLISPHPPISISQQRFPGSQPVSFAAKDLDKLEAQEYVPFSLSVSSATVLLHITVTGLPRNQTASVSFSSYMPIPLPATKCSTLCVRSHSPVPQLHTSPSCHRPQIDRHNSYRQLTGLYFPHHADPRNPLRDTIVDGELVIDVDPHTKQVRHFLLATSHASAQYAPLWLSLVFLSPCLYRKPCVILPSTALSLTNRT